MVEAVTVKLPNPMTVAEMVGAGMSPEDAQHKMNQRVFGHDYKKDENGNPIEQGIGSEANPFKATHLAAIKLAEERAKAAKPVDVESLVKTLMEANQGNALNAETLAAIISQAVSAGVQAGVKAGLEAKEQEL